MTDPRDTLMQELRALLRDGEEEALQIFLRLVRPQDIASWLDLLAPEERQRILGSLDHDSAGAVLNDTTASIRAQLIEDLGHRRLARIAEAIPADDAADLIGELESADSEAVLRHVSDQDEAVLRGLLAFPEDTAGGIMTPEVVALTPDTTVDFAIRHLRSASPDAVIASLYVVDDERRLLGFVRLRRLVTAQPTRTLHEIMSTDVITVPVDADQEDVAALVEKYDFIAVPVVDRDGHLLGAVTFDDIIDVISEEATEDIYKMAGSSVEEEESQSILHIARYRLPWLLICLAGTQLSTAVLQFAKGSVSLYEQMSVFTAAIMAMAGNTSLQSSTTTVRRLAVDTLPRSRFGQHVRREISVALLMGLVCGVLAAGLGTVYGHDAAIGLALGTAMALAMSAASLFGAGMPLVLEMLGIDPAVASGPLVSTINDSLALALYFSVATAILYAFA
ncbi:MAG TPA: magnesium transporter [Candidatus Sulfomarinibacteraceae bacterium]|nr:magnesium transporter [Candidatus Sulfomarinibacteraceae bacterium]